jgi:hypothetical protein
VLTAIAITCGDVSISAAREDIDCMDSPLQYSGLD